MDKDVVRLQVDVDEHLKTKFKAEAVRRGLKMFEAVEQAFILWLDNEVVRQEAGE